MFRKLNSILFWLSRSRLRKGPDIDPKLKDLTSTYHLKKQINAERMKFETSGSESFTQVINNPKPKLRQRFKIDTNKLNHDLKKMIKDKIKPENMKPYSEDHSDLKFLEEGKSYLNDQRAEVEFQEKFRKQLFMKEQTTRMLKKQANKYTNFLPQNQGNAYNQYLEARDRLKNKRIQSMMNYKRNNQQLQLLLDSGFMDDPANLQALIDKLNKQQSPQIEQIKNHNQSQSLQVTQPAQEESLQKKMDGNSLGPAQLKDYSKVQEFISAYQASSEGDKIRTAEDVDLLLKVRQYQNNLFLSRYEQINYRFKGRVKFENFKQFQLLSYIKHENILPIHLLEMFDQNKQALSRFNVPIITPAVISRIYTKTSTYRFAQNDENNHINLISHPHFVKLERSLFRQLDKISDELYCDTVWTYAKNHQQEQGILNLPMSQAIQKAIFNEMLQRISRLREVDLGLLMRSLIRLNIVNNQNYAQKWGQVIEVLQQRLPLMTEPYEVESVMQFIQLLPPTTQSIQAIRSNIGFFDKFAWADKGTLLTFTRISSCLINNAKLVDKLEHNKTLLRLIEVINNKVEETKHILSTLTINEMSNVLVVWSQINKYPLLKSIPPILINTAKKYVVDSIHMQKHKVYQYTLPTIIKAISSFDYVNNLLKVASQYIDSSDLLTPVVASNVMKVATLRHLLPGRAFVYNSKLYFPYHELARFIQLQSNNLSLTSIAQSLHGLSLVHYKNEGIYDSLTYKVIEKLEKDQREQKRDYLTFKEVVELMKIVSCYSFQKRSTDLIEQVLDKIVREGKHHFRNIKANILISFFSAYVNLFTLPTDLPLHQNENYDYMQQRWQRNRSVLYIFTTLYRDVFSLVLEGLQSQQVITLLLINTFLLNNTSRILVSAKSTSIKSQFTTINGVLKKNIIQLLMKINQVPQQAIKLNYQYAIALSVQLSQLDLSKDQIFERYLLGFQRVEKDFYERYIGDILVQEQNIGTSLTYKQTYDKIIQQLANDQTNQIKPCAWRVQVQNKQTVYFIATYEHLMSKHNESQASLALFGLWKLYSQMYRRRGWKFELVCSMLE